MSVPHIDCKCIECKAYLLGRAHGQKDREYIIGFDQGSGDDMTALVIFEKEPDGRHRVVAVQTLEGQRDRAAFYTTTLGWMCHACRVFTGEEKEVFPTCRSCGMLRPLMRGT